MEQKDRCSFKSMFERSQKSKPIGKIDEKSSSIWKPVTKRPFQHPRPRRLHCNISLIGVQADSNG